MEGADGEPTTSRLLYHDHVLPQLTELGGALASV